MQRTEAADPSPSSDRIGEAIRSLRVKSQLTLEELAAAAGIHWTYLSGIERGIRNPSLATLAAVAQALRVPASELVALAERLEAT